MWYNIGGCNSDAANSIFHKYLEFLLLGDLWETWRAALIRDSDEWEQSSCR